MRRTKIVITLFALLLSYVDSAESQQAIFLVRHADTVRGTGNPDVPLTEAGERRALALAALLKDSGINAIYTTGLQRTVKTAEPLQSYWASSQRFNRSSNPEQNQTLLTSSSNGCAGSTDKTSYWPYSTRTADRH